MSQVRSHLAAFAAGGVMVVRASTIFADPISLTATPTMESFNNLGPTLNAFLPNGWLVDSLAQSTHYSQARSQTTQSAGTTGSGTIGQGSTGGTYNFGNGPNASATDRAPGWLGGGTYSAPRNLFAQFQNATGSAVSAIALEYSIERYRSGTRALAINLFVGADGSNWTSVPNAAYTIPATAGTNTVYDAEDQLAIRQNLQINSLSIAPGGSVYLRWEYVGNGGSTNTPAIGIDDILFSAASAVPVSTWTAIGSGAWATPSNWSTNVPDGSGATASFASAIASPASITLGGMRTAGALTFASTHRYTLTGGTLVLNAPSNTASLNVVSGDHTIQSAVTLETNASVSTAANTSLTITAPLAAPSRTLIKSGSGTLKVTTANLAMLNVQSGTLQIGGVTRVQSLAISGTPTAPTAKLDLGIGGAIILDYSAGLSPKTDTKSRIAAGRGSFDASTGNFTYTGQGITSTSAATQNTFAGFGKYSIALIDNADLTSFNGAGYTTFGNLPVDVDSLIVRVTYTGDANLDGKIDAADYLLINRAFAHLIPNVGWLSGDFNEDGEINADDYALIDFGRLTQQGTIGFETPIAVPEPTSLILLTVGGYALATRRRRSPVTSHLTSTPVPMRRTPHTA